MKKIALFVEGQTEQVFAAELIRQVFNSKKIAIESLEFSGKMGARKITILKSAFTTQNTAYYFRIYDCHGGGETSTVKSDIIEQISSLSREGFSSIIGIRDVYPLTDVALLRKMLGFGMPKTAIPINIVLAVQEIEAWFIAEEKHYKRISPLLSIKLASLIAGIDLRKDSTENLAHPAKTLHNIYHKVGCAYGKTKKQVERTVNALDYENLYLNVRKRSSSLNELLNRLDEVVK